MKLIVFIVIASGMHLAGSDPSLIPLKKTNGEEKYAERFRILTDLDGDGVNDMLLSKGPEESGSMGYGWSVYSNRKGEFRQIGEIWAHPMAIAVEPDRARMSKKGSEEHRHARIWVYLKGGGNTGSFGYYRVGEKSVDKLASIEIYPGDAGTVLGNAIYNATFEISPIPIVVERSSTSKEGKVSWAKSPRRIKR